MSEDLIKRSDAIRAFNKATKRVFSDKHLGETIVGQIPSADRWIPCSERLPKKYEQVLCCNKDGRVFSSALTYVHPEYIYWYFGKHRSVIAWMPLPKPYTADRKTEPQRACSNCKDKGFEGCEQPCLECGWRDAYKPKDEPFDEDINVRSKDEPQTCSVSGRPYSECADCEHFKCTADEPQKIMEKCYSCKWWNYSYGCSNKKGICEFEPLKEEQTEGVKNVDYFKRW